MNTGLKPNFVTSAPTKPYFCFCFTSMIIATQCDPEIQQPDVFFVFVLYFVVSDYFGIKYNLFFTSKFDF